MARKVTPVYRLFAPHPVTGKELRGFCSIPSCSEGYHYEDPSGTLRCNRCGERSPLMEGWRKEVADFTVIDDERPEGI